jgi:hypothetical protein
MSHDPTARARALHAAIGRTMTREALYSEFNRRLVTSGMNATIECVCFGGPFNNRKVWVPAEPRDLVVIPPRTASDEPTFQTVISGSAENFYRRDGGLLRWHGADK